MFSSFEIERILGFQPGLLLVRVRASHFIIKMEDPVLVKLPSPDKVDETIHNKYGNKAASASTPIYRKGNRPLRMPKNYSFSQRGVDWSEYKRDFILRTDAVWEKIKMKDIFYSFYKVRARVVRQNFAYNAQSDRYWVNDIREHMYATMDAKQMSETWVPFTGYSVKDGVVWQFAKGPYVARPDSYTDFVAEKERDNWSQWVLVFTQLHCHAQ